MREIPWLTLQMEIAPEYIEDSSEESSLDSDESFDSWISQYCSTPGNEYYCPVNIDFALDRFNLAGLGHDVPHAQAAYQRIISEKCNLIPSYDFYLI